MSNTGNDVFAQLADLSTRMDTQLAELSTQMAALMSTVGGVATRVTAIERRRSPTPPAQPLGTHNEVGNNSHEPRREPLEDQDALYRRARGRGGNEDRRRREVTPVHVQEEENHEPPPRVQPPRRPAYREELP